MTTSTQPPEGETGKRPKPHLAAISLTLGIAAMLPSGYGLWLSLPAIILGHFAKHRTDEAPSRFSGSGMALAGLLLAYFSIPTALIVDSYVKAREKGRIIKCVSNMQQITLGARILAYDSKDGKFPTDWVSLQRVEINVTQLVCPSDKRHKAALNWSAFGPENVTYEMVTPGATNGSETNVFLRCPIHAYETMADGSVKRKPVVPIR